MPAVLSIEMFAAQLKIAMATAESRTKYCRLFLIGERRFYTYVMILYKLRIAKCRLFAPMDTKVVASLKNSK